MNTHRLVAVFGRSGVGKSSLLRAGLLPRFPDAILITPGMPLPSSPMIVVDQFEEVFTLLDDDERSRLISQLTATPSRVVLGVRADFYAHCARYPELLRDGHFAVGPMTADELRDAIVRPAARAECTVEGALVTRLVSEATGQPGVLPMVSHALLETWKRKRGNTVTLSGYEATGGIERAIANTAEQVYATLDPHHTKQLFLRLATLGDGTEDTRRRLHRSELDGDTVPDELVRARLITVDRDTVEISHETLFRSWPRLRDWLAEDRDGLRVHRQLTEASATWTSLDRDPGALYRGARLSTAQEWSARTDAALTVAERDFLKASTHAHSRRNRRLRQLVGLLSVLFLVAATTSVFAVRAQRTANEQRDQSLAQNALLEADRLQLADPGLAAQLRLAAYRLKPSATARDRLLSNSVLATRRLTGHTLGVAGIAFSRDGRLLATASKDGTARIWDGTKEIATFTGHTDSVYSVAFSPAEPIVATAGRDRTVRLWDLSGREVGVLTGHTDWVLSAAFSPDGRVLVTGSRDRTVRLWDVASRRQLSIMDGHTDMVRQVAFAPDGRTIATAGWDRTVRLWDPATRREVATLTGHTGAVQAVAFHPSSTLLASGGGDADGTTRIWDVATRREVAVLRADKTGQPQSSTEGVQAVAFSPDGAVLASAGWGEATSLWDTASGHPLGTVAGHTGTIWSLAFSPDGRTLATGANDTTARLEDLRAVAAVNTHTDGVLGVAFSADGQLMATGGLDQVHLWSVRDGFLSHLGLIDHGAWSLALRGRTLAVGDGDGRVRLWDVTDPAKPKPLQDFTAHPTGINQVIFFDDMLLTASSDSTAAIWTLTGERLATLPGDLTVQSVAVSMDGRTVAAVGGDRVVRLWSITDPRTPTLRATLSGHTDGLGAVAFDRIMATGGGDTVLRLWNDTKEIAALDVGAPIECLTFSPDGQLLAACVGDAVRLWRVGDRQELGTLTGHTDTVYGATFSPDGRTLVSVGADRAVRTWPVDPGHVRSRLCASPAITPEQWAQHFPGQDYAPPCASPSLQ